MSLKITHCIVSSNDNKLYYDFYPIVKKTWETLVGVKMIFVFVGDSIPQELLKYKDDIYLFSPIKGIPTSFTSQIIRILLPSYIQNEATIITGDIDLMPMSGSYFINSIKNIKDDKFVNLRVACKNLAPKQYAICYNIAKTSVWKEIFPPTCTLVDMIGNIYREYVRTGHDIWYTDQEYLYEMVNKWNAKTHRFSAVKDEQTNFNRLDRIDPLVWIINNERKELIRKGYYCDYHMLRPYEGKNKNHVDEVVRILLNENDTLMETHLTVLKSIFKYVDVNNCVEFGSDSTDILIKNCKYLMSIEMNSQELYDKAREEFKEYKHWDFLLRLGKDSYREIEYPKIDLCLVDGHEDNRPECVNLMLQKQVPIIVVHGTEQPRNRINDNTYYSITYNKTTPWTTVFTSDQNLAYYLSQDLA